MIELLSLVVLVILPGAWATFGFRLQSLPFWARLVIGAVLSPFILFIQFYILRLLGADFELTSFLLVLANLPALYLVYRATRESQLPGRGMIPVTTALILINILSFTPQILGEEERIFTGHAWMHTDTAYMLANGQLDLEESLLAGFRQAYPWAGHVYEAVIGYLLDSPPAFNYVWTNILWVIFASALLAGIIAELGGNRFSQMTAPLWLLFGTNFLGFPLHLGDYRYTPLLMELIFFCQMPFAVATLAALLYLMVKLDAEDFRFGALSLSLLLLVSIGFIYPILFPAACVFVIAKIIALLWKRSELRSVSTLRKIVMLGSMVLIAGVLSALHFNYVVRDRGASGTVELNLTPNIVRKVVDSAVAPAVYYLGLGLVIGKLWKEKQQSVIVLLLGALGSLILYITILIHPVVEYKFMFPAILSLAAFPGLALQRYQERFGNKIVLGLAAAVLLMAAPYVYKIGRGDWPALPEIIPQVDRRHFSLRLADVEKLSGLYDAIRELTPVDSIVVTAVAEYHMPTLTRRVLYVPPDDRFYAGINKTGDHLLVVNRGYDAQILLDRRVTLQQLFISTNPGKRSRAIEALQGFNRPIVIVLDDRKNEATLTWLQQATAGSPVYQQDGYTLWLIKPQ